MASKALPIHFALSAVVLNSFEEMAGPKRVLHGIMEEGVEATKHLSTKTKRCMSSSFPF